MATSGSVDWSLTSRQIISEALENIGVTSIGDTPAAEDAAKAMSVLNQLIKTWGTQGLLLQKTEGSVTLVDDTASYASSPVSLARRILSVRRRTSGLDTPLEPLSYEEYQDLPNKTQNAQPTSYFFDPQRATRTLYVWPVPDATIAASTTLKITYQRVIEDVDALDNDPDFPQEWMEALVYGLAARLIVPYRMMVTDPAGANEIKERAAVLFQTLQADSQEDVSVFISPA